MASGALPWTLQTLLNELYYNAAPLPVPRRAVEPIITSMLQSPKTSLRLANKALEKTPSALVKTLKAVALDALHKTQEAKSTTRQVLAEPKGLGEAGCLMLLTQLSAKFDMQQQLVQAADAALTAHPQRKDLFISVMGLYLQSGDFKKVQQIALRMYKQFKSPTDPTVSDSRWLQAAIQAMLMQCRNVSDPQSSERSLLLALIDRNLQSLPQPQSVDDYHLRSQYHALKGSQNELEWFKTTGIRDMATKDLGTDLKRRDVVAAHGSQEDKVALAQECLNSMEDKNWATISMAVNLSLELADQALLDQICQRLEQLAQDKELGKERGYALGLLLPHKLQKSQSKAGSLKAPGDPLQLIADFYSRFSSKYSTWSDIEGFLMILDPTQYSALSDKLKPKSGETMQALQSHINKERILLSFRHLHNLEDADVDWMAEANRHVQAYFAALPLGKDLPLTDLQYADEYALLASECWLRAWKRSGDSALLLSCAALLDFAVQRSPYRYQIRLLLVRVYRLLGLPVRALEQFKLLGAKQIQLDTLAHYAMDRSSSWAQVSSNVSQSAKKATALGESSYLEQLSRMDGWYHLGLAETTDSLSKVWRKAVWQKVSEYHELYDRLSASASRASLQVNMIKTMSFMATPALSLQERIEKLEALVKAEKLHDNTDESLLPLSVRALSEMGPKASTAWLDAILKTTLMALKLQDPSFTGEALSTDLLAPITALPASFTAAERDWVQLVDACRRCRAEPSAPLDQTSVGALFKNCLTAVESLPKSGGWSWQVVEAACQSSEALIFLQGFVEASSRQKPSAPELVRSLKATLSEVARPAYNTLIQNINRLSDQPLLGEAPLAGHSEIAWKTFSSAAVDEWRAECKEIAARMKRLA